MKQILYFGEYGCTTGFANVTKELFDEWTKQKDIFITVYALNNHKEKPYTDENYKNVFVIPVGARPQSEAEDHLGRKSFLKLMYNLDFDLLFCLGDVEMMASIDEHIRIIKKTKRKENRKNFKSIFYFPIDSYAIKKALVSLDFFDEIVTYTDYAKNHIKEFYSENSKVYKNIKTLPHGCDKRFYNKDVTDLKKQMFGDKFVFGSINRNSARKDMSTLLMAFQKASIPNSVLYLHCNPKDNFGMDLFNVCDRIGLEVGKDVFFPENFSENIGYDIEQLNDVYNTFDCFVTTTTAEGWGLTVTEAMQTETLVICPLHTSLTEITNFGKNVIPITQFEEVIYYRDLDKIRYKSRVEFVVEALLKAFFMDDSEKTTKILEAKNFISQKYQWKKTADSFMKLIRKHIG